MAREDRNDLVLRGRWSDLAPLVPGLGPVRWEAIPKDWTDLGASRSAIQDAGGRAIVVDIIGDASLSETFLLFIGVISVLGLVLIGVSIGGVLNTVLLETRQRARELAVLKALGMTPRQVVAMVASSVVPVGLLAGLIGLPVGLAFQRVVLGLMGQAAAQTDVPASVLDVFTPVALLLLALAGVAIGILGAYPPAQRAARARIAPVLQAE